MKIDIKSLILDIFIISLCIFCIFYLSDIIYKNKSLLIIDYILLFLVVFYISITIHEFAHSLVYIFHHMKIRAIYIFPFCFIKDKNAWRTVFNLNNIGLMGASVVEQFEISNEADFKRMVRVFAKSMLFATVSGIVMTVFGLGLIILGYIVGDSSNLITVGCMFLLVNFILVINSFNRTGNTGGDYFAYKYIFNNYEVAAQFIFNYMKLSSNYDKLRKNSNYLRKMLTEIFERRVKENIIDVDAISIATGFISDFLVAKIVLPDSIERYVEKFNKNANEFNKIKNLEICKKFITKTAYYYEFIGKHEVAKKIYNDFILQFPNENVSNYFKLQAEHIIQHKDNSAFLNEMKNIKPDLYYSFYRLFDGYIHDEVFLNEKLREN